MPKESHDLAIVGYPLESTEIVNPNGKNYGVCILGLKTKMIFGMSRHLVNGSSRSTSDLYHREEHMRGGCAIRKRWMHALKHLKRIARSYFVSCTIVHSP